MRTSIEVLGARQNNLKNIDVKIPRNKLTVVTGVSGSGKSSLAFDVIFGEGQRLFLESLSTYAKSRVVQVRRPDVDFVFGLSSVVSIEQHRGIRNLRSTVGSLTDISTYLRLLYSTKGKAYCPYCDEEVPVKTSNQIVEYVLSLPEGTTVEFLAPAFKIHGENYRYLFDHLRRRGIGNVRIDGRLHDIGEKIELDEEKDGYIIEAFIDKFQVEKGIDIHQQMLDTVRECQRIGEGFIHINIARGPEKQEINEQEFFKELACPEHHLVMGELQPWYFSPNEGDSACLTCGGLGIHRKAVPFLIVEDEIKSIRKGAVNSDIFNMSHPFKYLVMYSLAEHCKFNLDVPFKELPDEIQDIIFYGTKGEKFELKQPPDLKQRFPNTGKKVSFEGLIPPIDRWYKNAARQRQARSVDEHIYFRGMIDVTCPDCNGTKLLKQRLQVRIDGKNIFELGELTLTELYDFLGNVKISEERKNIELPVLEEIKKRLNLLMEIGVDYLNLNRIAHSISGGEMQRIRMSTQIGSGLMGMIYILDEPSIGLHSRDNYKIINTLKKLRDIGNTVIVVEHDIEMMNHADHILDIGPGSGEHGGELVAQGSVDFIKKSDESITGQFLAGKKTIDLPAKRRISNGKILKITGARENNLKNLTVKIPLEKFVSITGVSGSGKSSLINGVLYKALHSKMRDRRTIPGEHDKIEGLEYIKDIRNIDQSPIGRSSRSNPATYVGFFDKIRDIYAKLPESKERSYTKTTFSYNSKNSGRCEECEGSGEIVTSLQFMPDVRTTCPVCKGRRYREEVLEIKYRNLNIADVLQLSVEKAMDVFKDVRLIHHKLKTMNDLGLGYLKLGQSSTTLSGGEAQRIKLANELGKLKRKEQNLYIFDEPSTGLHLADIQKLLGCMDHLIEAGNSVVVIEHNLDIIKMADHVIDLGPDGGNGGGLVVAEGTPEKVAKCENSHTGQYLKPFLEK
ncbi:MAG: excinuclease ABC subunit UvrA [Candidatus Hodarchaeales archaeon]